MPSSTSNQANKYKYHNQPINTHITPFFFIYIYYMYLAIYEEELQALQREIAFLNNTISKLQEQLEQQAELIYTLKQTLYKTPDLSDGEASSYYDDYH